MKRSFLTGASCCLLALFTTLPLPAADRVLEDEDFAPANWTFHVRPTGWGGSATNFHRPNDLRTLASSRPRSRHDQI
jgi:hypothetical protein